MDPEDLLRTNVISDKTHVGSSGGIQSASNDAARPNAADEVLPTLPLAPTLAPGIAIKEEADANATPGTYLDDGGKEIVKALEALPIGSPIAFASEDLGALLLADAPIVRGTEAYRQVEHLAQACNCSVSLQEKTNTITFYRNETAIKHEANEDLGLKARARYRQSLLLVMAPLKDAKANASVAGAPIPVTMPTVTTPAGTNLSLRKSD